jgi:membrane protein implicated in regulation of membrane protease activity
LWYYKFSEVSKMTPEIIFWLAMLVVFIIVEATTSSLVSIWFAAGSLIAVIPAITGGPFWLQLVVFTVISAGTLALLRPFVKQYLHKPGKDSPGAPTNSDRNIGEIAVCTERIDNAAGQGAVRLLGKEWTARTADGTVIGEGTPVQVESISGVKLIVSLVQSPIKEEITH